MDRHAVERLPRRVPVRERELDVALPPHVGELGGEAAQVQRVGDRLLGQVEAGRVGAASVLPPAVEVLSRGDVATDALVVEVEQHLVVDDLDPAQPVGHPSHATQEVGVAGEEVVALHPLRRRLPFHERLRDEPGPRRRRVDPVVADHPVGHERQPVQRDVLGHDGPTAALVPPRLAVRPLHEVRAGLLGPLRLDAGDAAGVDLVRLDQLGGHHPVGRALGEHRAGGDHEAGLAGADEVTALAVAHTDVREQPGEERLVDEIGMRLVVRGPDAEFAGHPAQLAEQIHPLPHAQVVEELVAAHPPELIARQCPLLFAQVVPQCDHRQEVGPVDAEAGVHLVGLLALLHRALARILDRQPGRDDEHLAHAPVTFRLQHHPPEPRVDREAGEPAAEFGEVPLTVALDRVDRRQAPRAGGTRRGSTAESGGSRNGNAATSPRPMLVICRMTDARFVRRISGSVNSGRSAKSSSSYRRMQMPGATRPHRPARWLADACDTASIGSRCTLSRLL